MSGKRNGEKTKTFLREPVFYQKSFSTGKVVCEHPIKHFLSQARNCLSKRPSKKKYEKNPKRTFFPSSISFQHVEIEFDNTSRTIQPKRRKQISETEHERKREKNRKRSLFSFSTPFITKKLNSTTFPEHFSQKDEKNFSEYETCYEVITFS